MDIRARVEALNAERLNVVEQLRAELDATAGRERSAEEQTKIDRMDARIDEIDAEVREFVARETREREAATLREHTLSVFGDVGAQRNDQAGIDHFRAWLNAPRGSDLRSAQFEVDIARVARERDLIRQGASTEELRALAWDASSGSLVVPTTMARSLYDVMEASIAGFRIGANRITTSSGENMQLPKLTTHGIASQVAGQGSAFAGGDPVFNRVDLNVYKYGQIVKVANELVTDAAFGIEQFLGQDLGYALGRVINTDLVIGTGSSEPTGMTKLAGAGTNAPVKTGGSLIAPTVEKFIDCQYSINDAYRANASWLMRDSVAGTVRKLRDGAGGTVGAFLWEPSLTSGLKDGTPDRFLGSPVYTDPNCGSQGPADAIVATYGDFSQYTIRTVGNPVIERDDSVYFASDEAAFRGKWRVGGNHRQVSAVNNLTTTV
jgi:HK97 family phage major capsid protein